MTRIQFAFIAQSLSQLRRDIAAADTDNGVTMAVDAHVARLVSMCKRANPAFDRARFDEACSIA